MPTTTTPPASRIVQPDVLTVVIDVDELRVRHGHRIDSAYVEECWTGIIGPTGIALLRLIARRAVDDPYRVPLAELGEALGVSANGIHCPLRNSVRRLVRFGAGRWLSSDESAISIYSHMQPVPLRLRERWSPALQARHDAANA